MICVLGEGFEERLEEGIEVDGSCVGRIGRREWIFGKSCAFGLITVRVIGVYIVVKNYIIHTLSIINRLVSLFQLHSKVLIFGSFSSRTLHGPILSIPVSELVPGPPFSQTPSGSLAGSERDSKNQKKRGESGT